MNESVIHHQYDCSYICMHISPFVSGHFEEFPLCSPQLLLKAFLLLEPNPKGVSMQRFKNTTHDQSLTACHQKSTNLYSHKQEILIFALDFCISACSRLRRPLGHSFLKLKKHRNYQTVKFTVC